MSDARTIQATITADTSGLQRGMQDASESIEGVQNTSQSADRGVQRSSRGMTRSMGRVAAKAKVVAAAAAAAGAAYAAHLVRQGLQAADEQAKLARQLGITNEGLATMQRAAELSGMSAGELTSNMERLNRRLGDAADGSGQAADALERIGLTAQDLENMAPDEQMETLGDALSGVGSQAERASIAADLFGRSGQRMLLLLDDAADTFDRARREVDDFGLALDETQTDQIEQINDDFSTMSAAIRGAGMQLASAFAPAIEHVASVVVSLSSAIGRWSQSMGEATRQTRELAEAQGVLEGIQAGEERTLEDIQEARNAIVAERQRNAQRIVELEQEAAEASAQAQEAGNARLRATFQNRARQAEESIGRIEDSQSELGAQLSELSGEYNELWQQAREGDKAAQDQVDAMEDAAESQQQYNDILGEYEESRRVANELAEAGLISERERIQEVISAGERYTRQVAEIGQTWRAESNDTIGFIEQLREEAKKLEAGPSDEEIENRLEMFRQSLLSETEALREQRDERIEILREARERDLLETDEYHELLRQARQEYNDQIREMEEQAAQERQDILDREEKEEQRRMERMARRRQQAYFSIANNAADAFGYIADASASSDEQQFRSRKAAGIASAVVNTAEGVTRALSSAAPPLNFANAAAVAASGAAQIAAISRQTMGGGGGGGSVPSPSQSDRGTEEGSRDGGGERQERRLIVSGMEPNQLFTGEAVRSLMDEIAQAQEDGYKAVLA